MIASSRLDYADFGEIRLRLDAYKEEVEISTSDESHWLAANPVSERPKAEWRSRIGQSRKAQATGVIIKTMQIFTEFKAAKSFCEGVDADRIVTAATEATRILNSGIFPDFIEPNVSVDDCGEFSISLRCPGGYLDIGVCGDGELSYHVRNDLDASKTAYGDVKWNGMNLPDELVEAAIHLVYK